MEQRKHFIDTTHVKLSVRQQCELLAINRSSLYYNKVEDQGDIDLLNLIREIWLKACYLGYRKITIILNRDYDYGVINHKRVQRLMQCIPLIIPSNQP